MPKGSVIIANTFNFKDLDEDKKVGNFYIYIIK